MALPETLPSIGMNAIGFSENVSRAVSTLLDIALQNFLVLIVAFAADPENKKITQKEKDILLQGLKEMGEAGNAIELGAREFMENNKLKTKKPSNNSTAGTGTIA